MIHETILGGLAGLAATAPMTAAMKSGHRRLPWYERYPLPPRQITMRLAKATGVRGHLDGEQKKGLTLAAHYGYGAAMGSIFGALTAACGRNRRSNLSNGVMFGLGVWTASYLGLLPALGILKPATQHPARRNLLMIGAHVVWGASLAALLNSLEDQDTVAEDRRCGDG